jgi:integrase
VLPRRSPAGGLIPKLTKRVVDNAKPASKDRWVWDGTLPGFGVRVKPSGVRSYLVQYRNANGRTRKLTIGKHGELTAQQARDLARSLLVEVRRGSDPAADREKARGAASIKELGARYMSDHARPKKRASSVASDARLLEKLIIPRLGSIPVADLTRNDVDRFHQAMKSTPIQANRALTLLSKMMNLAERWGIRADGSNPCRHVDRFREQKRERYLSAREVAALNAALDELELEGLATAAVVGAVRVLLFTGARRGEIVNLRWEGVDLENRCLRLRESKTGPKVILLNAPALRVLGHMPRRSEWVFPTERGDTPVSLSKPWERIRRRAGTPDVRIHDLRHTAASFAVDMGASLPIIGRLLGHTVPSTTARYAHLSNDPVREVSERLGARLSSAMNAAP